MRLPDASSAWYAAKAPVRKAPRRSPRSTWRRTLALLKLDRDLGLKPIDLVTSPPDTRAEYYTWGYPHAVNEMIDTWTRIGGGQSGGATTLGSGVPRGRAVERAVRGAKLPDQGHGDPAADHNGPARPVRARRSWTANGRVVGIVDGGLLGGWRGINWSISALHYLPGLPASATGPRPSVPNGRRSTARSQRMKPRRSPIRPRPERAQLPPESSCWCASFAWPT